MDAQERDDGDESNQESKVGKKRKRTEGTD